MRIKNFYHLLHNYVLPRTSANPSTTSFWYLPEPAWIETQAQFEQYQHNQKLPPYLIDYRAKLRYRLQNQDGIIVLPYPEPIGKQINPEAAFQFALGLHQMYCTNAKQAYIDGFMHYADYFVKLQNAEGLWPYQFDWYQSKAPWYSALAQSRGAAVMLRAYLYSMDKTFLLAMEKAVAKFQIKTTAQGFLHPFKATEHYYFEEYPSQPTGVINGFMAALISLWELQHWTSSPVYKELWFMGIASLEAMLPHYNIGWWSLYDLDPETPITNVNSPRYHLLELTYLHILSFLTQSEKIHHSYALRKKQYDNFFYRHRAYVHKAARKVLYK